MNADTNLNISLSGDNRIVVGNVSPWFKPDDETVLIEGGAITADSIRANSIIVDRLKAKGLGIGEAVDALKAGLRVQREGWNGKGMHLELQMPDAHSKMSLPYVFMFTADGHRVPWLCSQTDLLATDYRILDADDRELPESLRVFPAGAVARSVELVP